MLKQVLGGERPLLHQPLVRRASSGVPESADEMSGRDAARLAEFIDGRRVAYSSEQNFLGDALLPGCEPASAALARCYFGVILDQVGRQQNGYFVYEKLRALFRIVESKVD